MQKGNYKNIYSKNLRKKRIEKGKCQRCASREITDCKTVCNRCSKINTINKRLSEARLQGDTKKVELLMVARHFIYKNS